VSRKGCVWVTGAGGLIGSYLVRNPPKSLNDLCIVGLTRPQLDLSDFTAVRQKFARDNPRFVIHCAALSKSPACQAQPEQAWKINVELTRLLSELANQIPLVFFSSDLVFDGRQGFYDESAEVNPLSIYAETKVVAENVVLSNPRHLVIRTSLNGGESPSGDRGFNEEMRNAWAAGKTLKLFTDEYRCPIAAQVTAQATWELALSGRSGLYHLAGAERLSRWEIGQLLAARWPEANPRIEPGSLKDYIGAPRPPDTSLDCRKAQSLLSFPLPKFSEWMRLYPAEKF
jgi:dTDP-4-dehydrorhamnose reductase